MKRLLKRIGLGVLAVVGVVGVGGGVYAWTQTSAYDESVAKVYDVAPLPITRSTDPAVIARGKHLTESLAGCAMHDCHGSNFAGGKVTDGGPLGILSPPNITTILPAYSDGELARLIRHGLKKDKRTVRLMPVNESNWLPDSDLTALVSFLRTVPPAEGSNPPHVIKTLGKIMDRKGFIPVDVARRINHEHVEAGPPPAPTAEYGKYIARLCSGCHGETFSGGKIPGTPPDFPIPLNITPDASGLKGWTYDDFIKVVTTSTRKDGRKLASFMPTEAVAGMDDTERHALWAYLQSLPPKPFGER